MARRKVLEQPLVAILEKNKGIAQTVSEWHRELTSTGFKATPAAIIYHLQKFCKDGKVCNFMPNEWGIMAYSKKHNFYYLLGTNRILVELRDGDKIVDSRMFPIKTVGRDRKSILDEIGEIYPPKGTRNK